ncbi:MAG: transglutaminaseTgpA domain-containing protein [Mycobacteriaceae bacterium]
MQSGTSATRAAQSAAGALALLLTCAALGPLFTSAGWVLPVVGTVAVIAATGTALRALRVPPLLVVLGQVLVLGGLTTLVFTDTALLGLVPGPAAVAQLRALLDGVDSQVATLKPPVAVTQEMLLLLLTSLGFAAIVVDLLVAGVHMPAIAGLVLLCVVTVPASLLTSLLPSWSFLLGSAGLLILFVSNSGKRATVAGPGAKVAGLLSPTFVMAVALSLACAFIIGSTVTGVGTDGRRIPSAAGATGVALNPFTQLRGELGERTATPLFTVAGMAQPTYLRAVTLDRFVNNRGWIVEELATGESPGPAMGRQQVLGAVENITVRGQRYSDRWLPSPGVPISVRGVDKPLQGYTYDAETGVLQTPDQQPLPTYTVQAVVPSANAQQLRELGNAPQSQAGIDPRWRQIDGVDPQVVQLARNIAGNAATTFDAAGALNAYFTNPSNGFVYDLNAGSTAHGAVNNDALLSFLTVTKRGYCEQYASAMAVLLRELGISARVVLGYTPGTGNPSLRTITSDDAHAWVEVFFAGVGWVTFDPTPLAGGRGIVPPYVAQVGTEAAAQPATPAKSTASPTLTPSMRPTDAAPTSTSRTGAERPPAASSTSTDEYETPGTRLLIAGLATLALLLLSAVGCVPAALRRRRTVRRLAKGTPDAAWSELIDLAADRGVDVAVTDTPRSAGDRLSDAHRLDARGRSAVDAVIHAVEAQWYGTATEAARVAEQSHRPQIDELVAAWQRCCPLSRRERAFPRSVMGRLHPRRRGTAEA